MSGVVDAADNRVLHTLSEGHDRSAEDAPVIDYPALSYCRLWYRQMDKDP